MITARYSGRCAFCEEPFYEGDPISTDSDGAWCHDQCATKETRPDESETACTTCWLVHPEGACDR